MSAQPACWHEANQIYLMQALASVRVALERRAENCNAGAAPDPGDATGERDFFLAGEPPALEKLCAAFGLSSFEREILLLCAGVELDSSFAGLVAAAQKDPRRGFATFGLALGAFPDAHWSALSPARPLRRWRLIEVGAGETLTGSSLRLDEQVLHYLAGVSHMDDRLRALLEYVAPPGELPDSQRAQAGAIAAAWSSNRGAAFPAIELCGDGLQGKRAVAAAACALVQAELYALPAHEVPHHPAELDAFLRLWQREAVLNESGLLIDCDEADVNDPARAGAIARLTEETQGFLIVNTRAPRRALRRPVLSFEIAKPTAAEQRALWRDFLGAAAARLNGSFDVLGNQFDFDAGAIRSACAEALQPVNHERALDAALWEACRAQARPRLDDLAQRIAPAATWEDLVLPEAQRQVLREIEIHVRQRAKVYQTWGFAARGARGLGISALFSGPSGTGKTMAGEVLAHQLQLDLYRIDLSQVVSKYIGETEKNLRRVFDAAEAGCAILLFDEADALFGKRSEVKDSHDRYANVEISYLLQRMEAYRGLAILTTNMKSALDPAFQRRIRFVVQFPFPDAGQRAEIWRRVFPAETPVESLDYARLARLQVAGGNIRNIAMNAAFLAAEAERPVGMAHLLQAARSEYAKLERPLTEVEIGAAR
ncbi:MAG TPA: ATP-binding protein [Candidatus Binatia bacterium]|jgi:hypothetical protein